MKLTEPQKRALRNLAAGRPSSHGLRGQSEHGGHHSVLMSLMRRGLITVNKCELTEAGRTAIAGERP